MCTPLSNCVLRNTPLSELASLKIETVADKLAGSAPTFWKLYTAAACSQWQSPTMWSSLLTRLTTAAGCLLKTRNQRVSALQYIISIVMHNSGAKITFTRLTRLGLAMPNKRALVKLQQTASTNLLCACILVVISSLLSIHETKQGLQSMVWCHIRDWKHSGAI